MHQKGPNDGFPTEKLDPSLIVPIWLDWFSHKGRRLPWRQSKDPYRIFVSEIMLQQTQVQTVIPYYERFMARFPTVFDLAAADEVEVLKLWEGLGYYARARHLLSSARIVVDQHHGIMPDNLPALLSLPGIGTYTAGAILSIAWQKSVPAVDGNAVRVFSRLTGTPWTTGHTADRQQVSSLVAAWLPSDRPGDFNEAIMDLGATLCLPKEPDCDECPLTDFCVAFKTGCVADFPIRPKKKERTAEQHRVLILHKWDRFHVNQRPSQGLLPGLFTFDWQKDDKPKCSLDEWARRSGITCTHLSPHTHLFTHLEWHLEGCILELYDLDFCLLSEYIKQSDEEIQNGLWVSHEELIDLPFPSALEPYRKQAITWALRHQELR